MRVTKESKMQYKKTNANNGITLIALVITIIVMFVLVGVTITAAINGGLFEYAGEAGNKMNNAMTNEQVLATGKIEVAGVWYDSIDMYIKGIPTGTEGFSEIYKTNTPITQKGKTAVIPKGFAVGITEGINKIEDGLVIQDAQGNQFVWIPVEKAIVTESEIAKIKADSGNTEMTDLEAVQSLVNSGTYPMAVQDGTDYKGILYNFTHNPDNTLSLTVIDWTSTNSFREPAVVSYYDTQEKFTTYGLGTYSNDLYQKAYNKMVQSVAQNGGFYVGRYEISLYTDSKDNNIKYAQTKKEQTALVSTTWYEMYKYERDYANYNTSLGVTSEMIWGSQWDQMMIFVNGKNDGVGAKFYVAKSGSRRYGNSSTKTGMNTKDRVANIFDLEASKSEWTQQTLTYRVVRGNDNACGGRDGWSHFSLFPTDRESFVSSRASLYIKEQ